MASIRASRTITTCQIMQILHVTWLLSLAVSVTRVLGDDCTGMDQCSCQYSDGSMVALHSLGNSDGTASFQDVAGSDGSTYSYNPCYPFDEGDQCAQAAACETNQVGVIDTIGTQQTATFSSDGGGLSVGYTAGMGILVNDDNGSLTDVTLQCDRHACTPEFTAAGAISANKYAFTLRTVCACPGGCTETGPVDCSPHAGGGVAIGGGSIFLIVVIALVVIYVVGGMAFMKFARKAQGVEIIPNVGFWTSVPGYVKAGALFVARPCLRRTTRYDSI